MLVYALVSAETAKAVDVFLRRADAKRIAEALADEPSWRDVLSVEPIDLPTTPN